MLPAEPEPPTVCVPLLSGDVGAEGVAVALVLVLVLMGLPLLLPLLLVLPLPPGLFI